MQKVFAVALLLTAGCIYRVAPPAPAPKAAPQYAAKCFSGGTEIFQWVGSRYKRTTAGITFERPGTTPITIDADCAVWEVREAELKAAREAKAKPKETPTPKPKKGKK